MASETSPSFCGAELIRRPILRGGARYFFTHSFFCCFLHVPSLGIPSPMISRGVGGGIGGTSISMSIVTADVTSGGSSSGVSGGVLQIVRLDILRLGTWREQTHWDMKKVI